MAGDSWKTLDLVVPRWFANVLRLTAAKQARPTNDLLRDILHDWAENADADVQQLADSASGVLSPADAKRTWEASPYARG
jgi:hypothetical protein